MRPFLLSLILLSVACGGGNTRPQDAGRAAPGSDRTTEAAVLETGAKALHASRPDVRYRRPEVETVNRRATLCLE
jgi:hypothetical protein